MSKCLGCGVSLQTDNINKEGYTRDISNDFCERCFRIKNYNEYKVINKTNEDFSNIFSKIENSKDLVLLLADVLNLDALKKIKLSNDIILVITKKDVWPFNKINYNNTNLNIVDKVIISSLNNYNFDELLGKIRKYQKSKNVYVVGFTNVGKSTMINKIIYNYSDNCSHLTVSAMPSTTLDFLKIDVDEKLTLIDTPGLIEEGNICNTIDSSLLKKIMPNKKIKPKIYQVNRWQSIVVSDIFRIDSSSNVLTFVMSNDLVFDRFYKDSDRLKDLKKITLNAFENSEIVISGLGFIKIKKAEKIDVYIDSKVNVYLRKS